MRYRLRVVGLSFGAAIALPSMLSGCGAMVGGTITTANRVDQALDRTRRSNLVEQHLEEIQKLQAEGNPLGDYLLVEANELGMVPDPVRDRQRLSELYQAAAAKGSVDAMIVVGIRVFNEGDYPVVLRTYKEFAKDLASRTGRPLRPEDVAAIARFDQDPSLEKTPLLVDLSVLPDKEAAWKEGMRLVEHATARRCFYFKTYIFAPHQKRCLAPRIAADDIWPHFRDGGGYPKDKTLRDHWYDKAIACQNTSEYQEAKQRCQAWGSSNQRVKGND